MRIQITKHQHHGSALPFALGGCKCLMTSGCKGLMTSCRPNPCTPTGIHARVVPHGRVPRHAPAPAGSYSSSASSSRPSTSGSWDPRYSEGYRGQQVEPPVGASGRACATGIPIWVSSSGCAQAVGYALPVPVFPYLWPGEPMALEINAMRKPAIRWQLCSLAALQVCLLFHAAAIP